MAPRLLVANLDCESEYALAADVTLAPRELELAPAATEASAAIGTLLRVFLDDRDRLWLPAAVDASRVPPVEGVSADPECIHGPLDADTGYRDVLSWGSSTSIDALIKDRARTANAPDLDGPIVDSLWSMPKSPSDIAARANDRARCLELTEMIGCALPGARMVKSATDLALHLEDGGARAAPDEEWIVKSRFSAAGRWRFRGRGRFPLEKRDTATVEHLFERFGQLVFEPWMARSDDFGCTAVLTADALCIAGFHRQEVDGQGRFRGLEFTTGSSSTPWFTSREARALQGVVEVVGMQLRKLGYVGPFGVDAWRFQDANGNIGFEPLGECNARMTMGLVARAWAERLAAAGKLGKDQSVRLRIGKEAAPCDEGVQVVSLLLPGGGDGLGAWLQMRGGG